MKIGSTVVGLHIAVLCAFALTQGCVTTESQGSGRGAGAKHKRPFRHEHKGKQTPAPAYMGQQDPYGMGGDDISSGSIIDDDNITTYTPPPVDPMPPQTEKLTEVYIVQKGDILSQLAVDFDTTTATLVEMNGLANPDVLYVGQELRVPAGRRSSSPQTTTKSASVKKGGTYTIQKGDTLSGIALSAGVSINDLRDLNGIKGDKIMAGEKIYIPSYGKVPSSAARRSSPPPKQEETKQDPVENAVPEVAKPAPPMMEIAAPATTGTPDTPVVEETASYEVVQDHVVYPGETLDDISRQYGVSKAEIMRLNNIKDETQIRESQVLRIPVSE